MQQPPQSPNPGAPGEQTFQMLWDCKFCDTTKLLGMDHRHCPNCGAAQDPEWRYFPAEADMKFVTNPKFSGADRVCPFCQEANSADSKFCKSCGGDLSTAKEAVRKDSVSTGLEGAQGVRDDLVKKKFDAEQAAIKGTSAKAGLRANKWLVGCAILFVVACLGIGGTLLVLSQKKTAHTLTVTALSWERTISTEKFVTQKGDDWRSSLPGGAYNLSCSLKDKCHTETIQVECGYDYVDKGDGSGSRKVKYCPQDKQVCEQQDYCSYSVDKWVFGRDIKASGGPNDPLAWPAFNPSLTSGIGAEREKNRNEVLNVVFKDSDGGQTQTYNPKDEATWRTYKMGQAYTVDVNGLGAVLWESMKSAGAQ